MNDNLKQPFDADYIMKKKKSIKRSLLTHIKSNATLRIALLGGSTTSEIKSVLELFLLDKGIQPEYYESEYNRWYEDSVFDNQELKEFKPQIIVIHTSFVNLIELPTINDDWNTVNKLVDNTYNKYAYCWEKLKENYSCTIIQNNFELPFYRNLGNLDFYNVNGITKFVSILNEKFAAYANLESNFYINDINYLAANIGLEKWHDRVFYHLYKFAMGYDCIPQYCYNLTAIISAILGKNKKCLVLDLDNTLWGGIIGDDGVDNIKIGHETAVGEGYVEFQKYVLELKSRGIILAVCSKNEENIARTGFEHPDSVLRIDDFAAFYANWEPKHLNIVRIAKEINIGLDSMVFIDDNPIERKIVRDYLPDVVVPEVDGGNPSSYVQALEKGRYFETVSVSKDDLKRNQTYLENKKRLDLEKQFSSYDDFLKGLEMKAEIKEFTPVYLDRITQLTNKTNQFNLTTKRYTRAEIETVANDNDEYITLYGRLADKFGDNGLVSIIVGHIIKKSLHIDLWLMSCRILKRDFEFAMWQELVKVAKSKGLKFIYGYYYKTAKNSIVKNMYKELSFELVEKIGEDTVWKYDINDYEEKKLFFAINEGSL